MTPAGFFFYLAVILFVFAVAAAVAEHLDRKAGGR